MIENNLIEIMERGLKALFIEAVQEHNIEKIRACINLFGADVNVSTNDGVPVLVTALQNPIILKFFLAQPNINVNNMIPIDHDINSTILMAACFLGMSDAVRMLCQVPGIDLNYQERKCGRTAAMFAVDGHKQDCVQVLSTVPGVDWNLKNITGFSPIAVAVKHGYIDVLRILKSYMLTR